MTFGIDDAVTSVGTLLTTAIDKIWPNPEDKAKADAQVMIATATAAVQQLQAAQAVMLAEEQSADPWTSRARPTFMYVIYFLILMSVPMGILTIFQPDSATQLIAGFHNWLDAIPKPFIDLFGIGYLGYSASRTVDKHTEAKYGK